VQKELKIKRKFSRANSSRESAQKELKIKEEILKKCYTANQNQTEIILPEDNREILKSIKK
jgi:hypothetical protein